MRSVEASYSRRVRSGSSVVAKLLARPDWRGSPSAPRHHRNGGPSRFMAIGDTERGDCEVAARGAADGCPQNGRKPLYPLAFIFVGASSVPEGLSSFGNSEGYAGLRPCFKTSEISFSNLEKSCRSPSISV